MRRISLTTFILTLLCCACGGSLSSEQRKKLQDRMQDDEIKRVTEGELMEAAFTYGRTVADALKSSCYGDCNPKGVDSVASVYQVKVKSIVPGDTLEGIEKQLMDAFMGAGDNLPVNGDVQKIGTDTLLFTKPIAVERPDGSLEFKRALSIRMPVKSVILSIKE